MCAHVNMCAVFICVSGHACVERREYLQVIFCLHLSPRFEISLLVGQSIQQAGWPASFQCFFCVGRLSTPPIQLLSMGSENVNLGLDI